VQIAKKTRTQIFQVLAFLISSLSFPGANFAANVAHQYPWSGMATISDGQRNGVEIGFRKGDNNFIERGMIFLRIYNRYQSKVAGTIYFDVVYDNTGQRGTNNTFIAMDPQSWDEDEGRWFSVPGIGTGANQWDQARVHLENISLQGIQFPDYGIKSPTPEPSPTDTPTITWTQTPEPTPSPQPTATTAIPSKNGASASSQNSSTQPSAAEVQREAEEERRRHNDAVAGAAATSQMNDLESARATNEHMAGLASTLGTIDVGSGIAKRRIYFTGGAGLFDLNGLKDSQGISVPCSLTEYSLKAGGAYYVWLKTVEGDDSKVQSAIDFFGDFSLGEGTLQAGVVAPGSSNLTTYFTSGEVMVYDAGGRLWWGNVGIYGIYRSLGVRLDLSDSDLNLSQKMDLEGTDWIGGISLGSPEQKKGFFLVNFNFDVSGEVQMGFGMFSMTCSYSPFKGKSIAGDSISGYRLQFGAGGQLPF
jgi:hypothetical protein